MRHGFLPDPANALSTANEGSALSQLQLGELYVLKTFADEQRQGVPGGLNSESQKLISRREVIMRLEMFGLITADAAIGGMVPGIAQKLADIVSGAVSSAPDSALRSVLDDDAVRRRRKG